MTYFSFLARFLGLPILLLLLALFLLRQRQAPWSGRRPALVILLHIGLALLYTTPWDNYLVATNVWWYDPKLVTGVTIGWVPIEEYTFFVLQPIFASLFLLLLPWRKAGGQQLPTTRSRYLAVAVTGLLWLASVLLLVSRWQPGAYLALELSWALPPVMLQLFFGADILWRYWRTVAAAILLPTLYLVTTDALAINAGIWTIDPEQSLHWLLFGVLPFEELLFFMLTNILVVFGVTLALAPESAPRLQQIKEELLPRLQKRPGGMEP